MRTRRLSLHAAALVALLGAACGGGGHALPAVGPAPSVVSTTSTTAPPAVAELTGEDLFNPDIATRPVVMVKVGDDPKARPQAGIDKADVVYEERVEGNTVRFLAVFQSHDATSVGPVRSVRSTDPSVVAPYGGVFVFSGGIPPFESLITKVPGLSVVGEDAMPNAFHLRSDRQRPYKTYGNTAEFRALAPRGAGPPRPPFEFLGKNEPLAAVGGQPASQATVSFGVGTVARWDWDASSAAWKRSINGTPQKVDGGGQFAFTNVILEMVPYRGTPYVDTARSPVDEAVTIGSGTATLLTRGQQIALTWS
jgi:hypothetical protein